MGSWCSKPMPTYGQNRFLGRLKSLSQEERFCDVQIEFSDGNRKFNSLVLASLSPFFDAMLSSSMKEGLTGEVSLPTVSVEVFDAVMSYYLDGEGELDEKALYEAVDACEMMELPDLKDVCILNLKENLSEESCIRIWQLSKKYTEDQELVTNAFNMILKNITMVSSQEEFLSLSKSDLLEIMKSKRPNLLHESMIFEAVLKWIGANKPEDACIKEILGEIRFQLIRESDLLKKVFQYRELLKRYKSVDKAIEMYAVNGTTTPSLRESKRLISSLHKVIIVCSSSDRPILHVHAWHLTHRKWYDLSITIPGARTHFAANSAGSKIVISGGKTDNEALSDTLIYNSFANRWERGPDLNTARYRHGSVEVNGKVYVLGGQNDSFLNSIEMLNTGTGRWETVGNLVTAVVEPVVMKSGNHIVVMGEYRMSRYEEKCLEMQCFDVENKITTVVKSYFGFVRMGASESSVIYIITDDKGGKRMYSTSIKEHNSELKLHHERNEIKLPDIYLGNDSKYVVTDGMGFIFNSSYTRQLSLSNIDTNVVLPTIPGSVRKVWSGFQIYVGDKSLHLALK